MAGKPQPSDSSSHTYVTSIAVYLRVVINPFHTRSELGQQLPGTMPGLDLTSKITKLEHYCSKVGGFSDVHRCRYTTPNGVKEVWAQYIHCWYT